MPDIPGIPGIPGIELLYWDMKLCSQERQFLVLQLFLLPLRATLHPPPLPTASQPPPSRLPAASHHLSDNGGPQNGGKVASNHFFLSFSFSLLLSVI